MRRFVAGIFLVALLAAQSPSGTTFEDGLLAYHRGDHLRAFEIWEPLAKRGLAPAQYSLGLLYQRGEGTLPDARNAARWYRKAADQGDPDAQFNLGLLYATGEGVRRDFVQAFKWFSLAYLAYPPGKRRNAAFANRENAAAGLTPEEVERAERLVRNWKPRRR